MEAHETIYWLKVLYGSDLIAKELYEELMADVNELYRTISNSLRTMKEKMKSE